MKKAAQTHGAGSKEPCEMKNVKGLSLSENADSTRRESAAPTPTHTDHLQGVGGWLLLFCIVTTILNPLVLILTPLPNTLSPPGLVIVCAMTTLSVCTGISLWRVASNALTWAKIYFAVLLCVQCLGLLGKLVRTPNRVGALLGITVTLAWLAYFMKSKRVRATFGSNLRRPRWL